MQRHSVPASDVACSGATSVSSIEQVDNLPMELTGGALARLRELTPEGMSAAIHLTITDEPPLAQAMVVITAVPKTAG